MNEKIKLPAQEWLGYDPERGNLHGYTFEQMRAFAEMIADDCVKIAESKMTGKATAREIREHFGLTKNEK
jgi:hypothetical protein